MREIPVHAKVECTDDPCGTSVALIFERGTRKVTHVVIEDKTLPHKPYQRMVPVDQIAETTPSLIRLRCSRDDVDSMQPFIHTRYVLKETPDDPAYEAGEGSHRDDEWGTPSTVGEVATRVEEEYVPPGELAVEPGTRVEATDGHIGIVEELIVDPADQRITHLVLQEGHFWGKREVQIPVSAIDRVEGQVVYLGLDKKAIEQLSAIRR